MTTVYNRILFIDISSWNVDYFMLSLYIIFKYNVGFQVE